jgi:hypothetical protein
MAGAGAIIAAAAAISMTFPFVSALAPHAPLPSPATVAAQDVRLDKPSVPVRIQVPAAGIDLPVVSSERTVRGNRGDYPLCDVAQYWTIYDLPGAPGTTWIYAHAQPGMFLPLFTISEATGGEGLLGKIVELQTRDGRLLRYRITEVKERAYNRKIAQTGQPSQHRLILQTSTGPPGTIPKLQVAARLIGAQEATEPAPKAEPRACWQPRSGSTSGNDGPRDKPTADPTEALETTAPVNAMTLVLGSGAVLLGATFIAVYVVRREP